MKSEKEILEKIQRLEGFKERLMSDNKLTCISEATAKKSIYGIDKELRVLNWVLGENT